MRRQRRIGQEETYHEPADVVYHDRQEDYHDGDTWHENVKVTRHETSDVGSAWNDLGPTNTKVTKQKQAHEKKAGPTEREQRSGKLVYLILLILIAVKFLPVIWDNFFSWFGGF
ncbi:hypothetical protein [Lapidilactobacillus luobeiensis]|uniref:hypothetical protein n=1 Tax=Lapidilactobacillus luobeiensis TaxID=2950371 RepID=UPI0021C40EE8|nr:hypothetical protein [Lapidilactobacillus luobeiensis]